MKTEITYNARWKELLVGKIGENCFHVELTMGVLHVYFPNEASWNKSAPTWAKGKWSAAKESAELWCSKEGIPITIDDKAWVEFLGPEPRKIKI